MAGGRIRTLKPELLEDEVVASLSVPAKWLFVSCILLADDHGNLRASPAYLKSAAFWANPEIDILQAVHELKQTELLEGYQVRGQSYLHLRNWQKHQKIDKPGKPKVPCPEEGTLCSAPKGKEAESNTEGTSLQPPTLRENSSWVANLPEKLSKEPAGLEMSPNLPENVPISEKIPDVSQSLSNLPENSRKFSNIPESSRKVAMEKEEEREKDLEWEEDLELRTSCVISARAGGAPAHHAPVETLIPLDLSTSTVCGSSILGRPDNEKQRKRVDTHQTVAEEVLLALNQARMRVVSGAKPYKPSYTSLGMIAERLDKGATKEECLHIVAVWEQEIKQNPKAATWFTHSTPFRPDKFAEKLALEIRQGGHRAPSSVVRNRPTATEDQICTEADLDRLLTVM